jgi:hypothetical protein
VIFYLKVQVRCDHPDTMLCIIVYTHFIDFVFIIVSFGGVIVFCFPCTCARVCMCVCVCVCALYNKYI